MSNLSLKPIANGKTVFFNSPLTRDNELVRTGISLDNSFYHALLLAYTDDYSSSSEDEKNVMVRKFITSLNKKITAENWQEINSKYKIITLDSVLIKNVEDFYEYLENRRTSSNVIINIVRELRIDSNLSLFEAIFELISFSHFKNTLKSTINDLNNKSIREYKPIFINNIVNSLNFSKEFRSLDQEKKKYIINIITNFLTVFFRELESDCFKIVKDKVLLLVNPFLINVVCYRFKRDLFIIDSETKLPLKYPEFVTGKKSFVLLKIGNNFEPIGRVKTKNNIEYEFDLDDEYIKKLSMFLLNPEKFKNKYSDLLSEYKNKKNVYVSDSENETEEEKKQSVYLSSDEEDSEPKVEVESREERTREDRPREQERTQQRTQERTREQERSREDRQERNREDRQERNREDRQERTREDRTQERTREDRQERTREDRTQERNREDRTQERNREDRTQERNREDRIQERNREDRTQERTQERTREDRTQERTREDRTQERNREDRTQERTREDRTQERNREDRTQERNREDRTQERNRDDRTGEKERPQDRRDKREIGFFNQRTQSQHQFSTPPFLQTQPSTRQNQPYPFLQNKTVNHFLYHSDTDSD